MLKMYLFLIFFYKQFDKKMLSKIFGTLPDTFVCATPFSARRLTPNLLKTFILPDVVYQRNPPYCSTDVTVTYSIHSYWIFLEFLCVFLDWKWAGRTRDLDLWVHVIIFSMDNIILLILYYGHNNSIVQGAYKKRP